MESRLNYEKRHNEKALEILTIIRNSSAPDALTRQMILVAKALLHEQQQEELSADPVSKD